MVTPAALRVIVPMITACALSFCQFPAALEQGVPQAGPGRIAGRISCLVVAVEIMRILECREAAFRAARSALNAHSEPQDIWHVGDGSNTHLHSRLARNLGQLALAQSKHTYSRTSY
jgi:hypothetical protein